MSTKFESCNVIIFILAVIFDLLALLLSYPQYLVISGVLLAIGYYNLFVLERRIK